MLFCCQPDQPHSMERSYMTLRISINELCLGKRLHQSCSTPPFMTHCMTLHVLLNIRGQEWTMNVFLASKWIKHLSYAPFIRLSAIRIIFGATGIKAGASSKNGLKTFAEIDKVQAFKKRFITDANCFMLTII